MGRLITLLIALWAGYYTYYNVDPNLLWAIGIVVLKWVGVIVGGLLTLWGVGRKLQQRRLEQIESAWGEKERKKGTGKALPVHPQIVYMQAPQYPQYQAPVQPVQQPGLIDLPLDKYEWEV